MIIADGAKVKIVKVIPLEHTWMSQNKEQFIGQIGIVDGTPELLDSGLYFYSLNDENGDQLSPFGWFEEEFELLFLN